MLITPSFNNGFREESALLISGLCVKEYSDFNFTSALGNFEFCCLCWLDNIELFVDVNYYISWSRNRATELHRDFRKMFYALMLESIAQVYEKQQQLSFWTVLVSCVKLYKFHGYQTFKKFNRCYKVAMFFFLIL
jgi:hypothetical protein